MKKLLIIDKDQTLVRSRLGGESFVQKPWDQVPIEGMAYKLNKLYFEHGWRIVIASNQGGVEAGKKSLESAILEMEYCLELFSTIDFALFCPDYAGQFCYRINRDDSTIKYDDCSIDPDDELTPLSGQYRKPNPGMLLLAKHIYQPEQCLFVGDRLDDEGAAAKADISYLHRNKFLELDVAAIDKLT
ncbi:MAG TPA: HAD-IIIA family hydrolase [Kamptonema sp.]|nr:HAD-IIIA family hydrolase [Kamptonema sp.]